MPTPTIKKITQKAAKNAIAHGEDYQGAQNEAYTSALDKGYLEEESTECAKDAGTWHGDYLDNDPGYRSCNCEDYPCCGH